MRSKNKLVHGVGRNDADYRVVNYAMVEGRRCQVWVCPAYKIWSRMLERCYSEKTIARHPTYSGCHVHPDWHSFSAFKLWMISKDYEGRCLDKDILTPGNKMYSQEKCVFVSQALNNFVTDSGASRGELAIGVSWNSFHCKFQATCNSPITLRGEHLGYFDSEAEASEAWRARKHSHACCYADAQEDPVIAAALRKRYLRPNTLFK